MSDRINAVFLEQDDEEYGPPARLLKVNFFVGGETPSGVEMEPVVYFQIGEYTEGTYSFDFKSNPEQSFSVGADDLVRALACLGVLDLDTEDLDD